jgi:hypothetical protein
MSSADDVLCLTLLPSLFTAIATLAVTFIILGLLLDLLTAMARFVGIGRKAIGVSDTPTFACAAVG